MKTLNLSFSFLLKLLFVLSILSSSAYALTFPHTDNFSNSSDDGWSRDDGDSNELEIWKDHESHKTFDFTSAYADKEVTVTVILQTKGDWEDSGSYQDYFRVQFNDGVTILESEEDGTYTKIYTPTLDSDGKLKISFYVDTTGSSEYVEIDYVKIEYISVVPEITPATYTIYNQAPTGTIVGSIVSTGSPDTFTILSGDINNTFSVTNTGDIIVNSAAALENNTTSVFTLEINASNANGYDVENFIVNLTDDIELSSEDVNTRNFTNVSISGNDSVTINGSILQIGNQLLCKNTTNGGTCVDPTSSGNTQNNYHEQNYAKIDTSSGAPSNNSMAKLVMQDGDEVVFARLYWSARIENITSAEKISAKNIQIKGPNASSYSSYTSTNSKYNWHDSSGVFDYAASQDVTDYISAQGEGEYYVGGITTESGKTGIYASWQLIVVVENSKRSLKNLSIYDGFYSVFSGSSNYPTSVEVNASGFITPTGTEPFDANLFIYMGESDDGYDDSVKLLKKDGNPNVDGDWNTLKDGANQTNDVVNASVYSADYTDGYRSNDVGMAYPNFKNVLGVDIDKLAINVENDTSQQFLSNSQTTTSIKITSAGDRFSLNMFAFETEVFVPEFCYDYAYSQQEQYFTEDNDGTKDPELVGNVIDGANDDIEVSIFIKSLVDSSIQINNMSVDISDINTTQATYITDSTKVAHVGDLIANPVSVTAGTTGTSGYIHNIQIGSLDNNEYFYIFYKLDPQMTTMDMPLTMHASYDLTLDGTSVEYTLKLSEDIPMCSNDNFNYLPPKGIFNIVHNNYYTNTVSNTITQSLSPNGSQYYNLPTQVTKREGNFKVISMNPDELDELEGKNTVAVAVEMIDVSAFHYTDASCKNILSSISDRVWVLLENNATSTQFNQSAIQNAISNGLTDISSSTDFYTKSRANAAFRTSYNAADENGSLVELEIDGSGFYTLKNLPSYTDVYCSQDMNGDLNDNNDLITGYCPASTPLTKAGVKQCMECVYGHNTKLICSRDNFSIRPEAFMIKINDQNQTNPSSTLRLADDVSGLTSTPSTTELQLASGYQYTLEINATNHLNNNSSPGYTKNYTTGALDLMEYKWSPSGVVSGCNDLNDSAIYPGFVDGSAELNSSLAQVGEYRLHMEDTTWTTVDHNPLYMTHHNSDATYFINSFTKDCAENTSATQAVNSNILNGCNISSNHDSSGSSLKYRDYNLQFHPYKFNMSGISSSTGLNNTPLGANSFIYMADMSIDQNMSYHLNGNINAQGYDNSILSNFVDACYAQPISLTINKTGMSGAVAHQYRFDNTDIPANSQNADINGTVGVINLNANDFNKSNNGSVNTSLNMNFNRDRTLFMNPESVTFSTYTSNCTTPANCTMNADLTNISTDGNITLNNTLTHFYGKAHTGRKRYEVPTDAPYNANIYYEIFCYGTINGNTCTPGLLPSMNRTDDIRWYINTAHNVINDGNISTVVQVGGSMLTDDTVDTTNLLNANPTTVNLSYDGLKGYPYKTTMEINASNWLIYNKYDSAALVNEFPVEFEKAGTGWSGEHETNTTSIDTGTIKTNRRSMW
ncbi:MAG: hypothetical protein H8E76_06610 [Helicobacteraceae bacterium]|nr:hypothetical protein [Candidatus Sulfurimonas ponti]MBL6973222.1 hypothetical protein [Sulfurimonas sp.]